MSDELDKLANVHFFLPHLGSLKLGELQQVVDQLAAGLLPIDRVGLLSQLPGKLTLVDSTVIQTLCTVAQAMFLPYDDHYYRSDVEKAGGWWVNHQGAGDQWYDKFYVDKEHFIHRETMPEAIVESRAGAAGEEGDPHHLREVERRHVLQVLQQEKGNKVQAARVLGISRRALYRLIAKYHLEAP